MLEITCPSCSRKLGLPENAAGRQVRCPACNTVFQVAAPAAAPPPPPAAVQPHAPAPVPPPAAPAPFDYDRSGRATPAPSQAFDFAEEQAGRFSGGRVRTLVSGAAGWLLGAGILNIVIAVLMLLNTFVGMGRVGALAGGQGGAYAAGALVGGLLCILILLVTPTVFIMIASSQLRSLRGRGLVITGCVMAFIVACLLLVAAAILSFALLDALRLGIPFSFVLLPFLALLAYLLGVAGNITAGVKALMVLGNPAVRAAYR